MPQKTLGTGSLPPIRIGRSGTSGSIQPPAFEWKSFATLLLSALTAVVPLLALVKDELRPQQFTLWLVAAILSPLALAFTALFPLIQGLWRHRREALAARAAEKEADILREKVAEVVNRALDLFHQELRWGGSESSLSGAATVLTCNLHSPEAASWRDVLSEITYCTQGLPTKVETALAPLVGRLIDQAIHRYVEHLPKYLDACERAVDTLPAQECEWTRKRANRFREQANDFIRTYRDIAKQAEALQSNGSPLRSFSSGALLPQPVLRAAR